MQINCPHYNQCLEFYKRDLIDFSIAYCPFKEYIEKCNLPHTGHKFSEEIMEIVRNYKHTGEHFVIYCTETSPDSIETVGSRYIGSFKDMNMFVIIGEK
ncbi:hypothetical protein DRQ09_05935 [candidate division KSB1 bacterium]|nr:MAG: hypothetical protein DRQ09_05935 [candidate division KSB1 bacterium]